MMHYNSPSIKRFMNRVKVVNSDITTKHIALLCLALLTSLSTQVFAVPPGTSIDSKATVFFTMSGSQSLIESSPVGNNIKGLGNGAFTRMTVDKALNFTVTSNDTPGAISSTNSILVLPGQPNVLTQFTITNTGNSIQDFVLAAVNSEVSGEANIDIPSMDIRVFVESGINPGFQNLEDTQQFIDDLLPLESQTIYVEINTPPSAIVNDFIAISLVAQIAESTYSDNVNDVNGLILRDESNHISPSGVFETITVNPIDIPPANLQVDFPCNAANNSLSPCEAQTTFIESGALDPEDITSTAIKGDADIRFNGQFSDSVGFLVTQSPVIISKSQTTLSPQGAHSEATIRYQLTIEFLCRTDSITDVIIRDVIPSFTTFTSGSILLNGVAPANTDFATVGGIGFDPVNNEIVANFGTQAAQASCLSDSIVITTNVLTFDVLID